MSSLVLALCQASLPPQLSLPRAADSAFESLPNGLRYRTVDVPGSRHEFLALVLEVGREHDPRGSTGMAEVVGAALTLAQEGETEQRRFKVVVKEGFTLLWIIAPVGEVEGRLQFLVELLDGSLQLDDDLLRRARAIAALRADDDSMIFPGPILRQRAQRVLLAGTAGGRQSLGIPAEITAISIAQIRARIRDSYRSGAAILGLLGGMNDDQLAGCLDALVSIPAGDGPAPMPIIYDPLGRPEETTTAANVDGPYVSAVMRAPEQTSDEFLPFLLAMEILRTRASRVFAAFRGAELQARFPFVAHNLMDGDRLTLINRRGENHSSLGDVQAEMTMFLEVLRSNPISEGDVSRAAETVVLQLALPPYEAPVLGPMVQQPGLLMPRALAMCTYELWNWPTDLRARIRAVSRDAVQRALNEYCDPERLRWFALVPR